MKNITVKCGKLSISNTSPFTLIAGPCQLENEKHAMGVAEKLKEITQNLNVGLIYKTRHPFFWDDLFKNLRKITKSLLLLNIISIL